MRCKIRLLIWELSSSCHFFLATINVLITAFTICHIFWYVAFSFYLQMSSKLPHDFFFDLLVVEVIFTFWWIFLFSFCCWFLVLFYMVEEDISYDFSFSNVWRLVLQITCGLWENILCVLEKTVLCCLEGNVLYMSVKSNWSNCAVKSPLFPYWSSV